MIVSELIAKLKEYPQEARVLGRGYENGYNDLEDVEMQNLNHVPNGPWYDGKYQEPNSFDTVKYDQSSMVTIT